MESAISSAPRSMRTADDTTRICGHRAHLTLIRSYAVPTDVAWGVKSFDLSWMCVYKDPECRREFNAFFARTLSTICLGPGYAGFILVALVPLLSPKLLALFIAVGTVIPILSALDVGLHVFLPVSPRVAVVRMSISAAITTCVLLGSSWCLLALAAHCDEAATIGNFPGRVVLSDAERNKRCVDSVEPYPVSNVMFAAVGGLTLPLPSVFFAILNLLLTFAGGRLYARDDVSEPAGELFSKFLITFVTNVAASTISFFRFRSAKAAFEATVHIEAQRQETAARAAELEQLLKTIVPAAVLPRLVDGGDAQFAIDEVPNASMLFADMKAFTAWSSSRSAVQVTSMLNTVVAALDQLAWDAHGVEKVKTIGDAYWAVCGIPVAAEDHADQLVHFGWQMNAVVAQLNQRHAQWGGVTWRVGVHSGPMTGALFGQRQVSYEVFGETSRVCQVVEANGIPGEVCVTSAVLASLLVLPAMDQTTSVAVIDDGIEVFRFSPPADFAPHSLPQNQVCDSDTAPGGSVVFASAGVSGHGGLSVRSISGADVSALVASTASAAASRGSHAASQCYVSEFRRVPSISSNNEDSNSGEVTDNYCLGAQDVTPSLHRQSSDIHSHGCDDFAVLEASHGQYPRSSVPGSLMPDDQASLSKKRNSPAARRWPLMPWFADAAQEAAYKAYVEPVTRPMSRVTTAAFAAFHGAVILSGFLQEEPCSHTVGFTLQVIAMALYLAAAAIAVLERVPLWCGSLALSAAVLLGLTGTNLTGFATCHAGYDTVYYSFFASEALMLTVGAVSWPVLLSATFVSALLPTAIIGVFVSPLPLSSLSMPWFAFLFSTVTSLTEEQFLRQRFLEEGVATAGEQQLQVLREERVAVLERLVPHHVVHDLVRWFGTGMDPERSIARRYSRLVVAFVQLRPEAIETLPRLHAAVDDDLARCGRARSRQRQQDTAAGDPESVNEGTPATRREPKSIRYLEEGALNCALAGLSLLEKIKTVGDIVMVAGPFPASPPPRSDGHGPQSPEAPLREPKQSSDSIDVSAAAVHATCDALLELSRLVRQRCGVRVGAHIGPVVGTVQGLSRLAFDTFGDVVNVASRVMSNAHGGGASLQVTRELRDVMADGQCSATFAASYVVEAKGKGTLEVFPVPD